MIMIMKIESEASTEYDYVICPTCKSRLCDKPKNEKVSLLQVMINNDTSKINHIVVKCRKCNSKYLMAINND